MKFHWHIGGLLALFVAVTWSLAAAGQTEILVSGAAATYQPQFGKADHAFVVQDRIAVNYGAARNEYTIPSLAAGLQTVMSTVTDRIIMNYAKSNRHFILAYPAELVNDQTPAGLGSEIIYRPAASDALTLTWTVNEFALSTLDYGESSGNYSQSIALSAYFTQTSVVVSGLAPGVIYFGRVTMADVASNQSQSEEFTFSLDEPPPPPTGDPLVMIYAVLDNSLGDDPDALDRLIGNVERGAHAGIAARLLIDGPGSDDSYAYEIQPGSPCISLSNPTCGGRYVENVNFWRWSENTAHPKTLYDFVTTAVAAHPTASHNILSLVGHGSGWTASALPAQPSQWTGQPSTGGEYEERVGGLLWDDTPGTGAGARAMSTRALGVALRWIRQTNARPIDLLYLDACSMGMAEVGYEMRNSANYLLASPNTAWSSFAYDAMLAAVKQTNTSETIGRAWLAAEKAVLDSGGADHPYTLALYNLGQMEPLAQAMSGLAATLQSTLSGQRNAILAAYAETERYESNYDGAIANDSDVYGDLGSLLRRLKARVTDPTLTASLQAVEAILPTLVVGPAAFGNGTPYLYPGQTWAWTESSGLAVYLPSAQDAKFGLYTGENIAWAQDSGWRDFLIALLGDGFAQSAAATELPTCISTRNCNQLPNQLKLEPAPDMQVIFLPLVRR